MKNVGKIFEEDFKKSIPEYCLLQRLNDSPQVFSKGDKTRFTPKNPCDFIMFDSQKRILNCFELKSTKNKYITFEDIDKDEQPQKMIHKHQILGLLNFSKYDYVNSGFVYNFRDELNNVQRTYFQDIKCFMNMYHSISKKSFNEMDIILNGAIKINGEKKRTRYMWDIDNILNEFIWR